MAAISECLAIAGPAALYAASAVPGVAFWDTGELQTVASVLGIAHPTGFPLFVMGGWGFARVFAIGDPAWRVSCFSALCAAGASGLLCRFVRRISGSATVGLAAAFAYAVGLVVWTRAARADAHDLALLFAAGALVGADAATRLKRSGAAVWAALWLGLGIATHPVVALSLPAVVVLAFGMPRPSVRVALAIAAATLLPLAAYAYVPLRSAYVQRHGLDPVAALGLTGGAFWDYGAPDTRERLLRYLGGTAFAPRSAFASAITAPGLALSRVALRSVVALEYGTLLAALVVTGFVWLVLRERRVALGLALVVAACALFGPNFAAESEPVRYFLPALWAAGICAGIGAWWFASALVEKRAGVAAAIAVATLAIGAGARVPSAARAVALQRTETDAGGFGAEVARRTADGSVVVARWAYAAPLAYDASVARTFGSRIVVSAAPGEDAAHFATWRRRFGHVYIVTDGDDALGPHVERLYASSRWQLAEVGP